MSGKTIFRNNKPLSLGIYGIVSVCLIFLVLMILPRKALADTLNSPAIQGRAPMPGSSDIVGGQQNTRPWFAVGVGDFNGKTTYAKVYVPVEQSATVTLTNGGGVCEPWGANSLDVGTPSVVYHLEDLATNEIYEGLIGPPYRRVLTNSGGCRDISFPIIPADAGIASEKIGHENYRVFFFVARILNQDGTGLDHEKNFKISTSSGLVGVSRAVSDYKTYPLDSFSIYQRDAPQLGGQESNYAFQFAPRCDEAKTDTQTSIKIYDADHGVYTPQDLRAILQRDDRAAAGFNWNNFADWSGSELGGDHEDSSLGFTAKNIYRYKMHLNGFNWRNTIQIQIPYDQFDAQASVGEACKKKKVVSCTATPSDATPKVDEGVIMTVKVTNNGDYPLKDFILRQTKPPGADKDIGSLDPGKSVTFEYNIAARGSPQKIDFQYRLVDSDGNLYPPSGQEPLCHAEVEWQGQPEGNLIVDECSTVRVQNLSSTATYTVVRYDQVPNPNPPPPTIRERREEHPRTNFTDIQLEFNGSDGQGGTDKQILTERLPSQNPEPKTWDTFNGNVGPNKFPFQLYPHYSYTVTLRATLSGDYGENDTNPGYNFSVTKKIGDPNKDNPRCMAVVACLPDVRTAPDIRPEPEEQVYMYYGMDLINKTNRDFNDYNVHINHSPPGSLTYVSPSDGVIRKTMINNARTRYDGPLTVVFNYETQISASLFFNALDISKGMNGVTSGVPCTAPKKPTPFTRPYLKMYDGDVSAGGAFRKEDDSCPRGDEFISPESGDGSQYRGGIRTYAYPGNGYTNPRTSVSSPMGASVDFGAHALGLIDGKPYDSLAHGFYGASLSSQSGNSIVASGRYNYLFFANQDMLGGKLGGGSVNYDAHCAPDFFDNTRLTTSATFVEAPDPIDPNALTPDSAGADANAPGQYFYNGPVSLTSSQITKKVTIYVNGDVYINGKIEYGNWDVSATSNTAPYFALLVRGNIHVDWSVSRLDGLYVAQPNSGTENGILSTCSVDNDFADAVEISNQCRQKQLTFNGAVIVQHVYLLRSNGSLTRSLGNSERPRNSNAGNVAEIFNYAPSMVIGQPNFKPTDGGAIVPGEIEGLFSLPPVF